jgi:hypothetical protein
MIGFQLRSALLNILSLYFMLKDDEFDLQEEKKERAFGKGKM